MRNAGLGEAQTEIKIAKGNISNGLGEAQTEIKIAKGNISNLRYAADHPYGRK